jgi:hypothetical protein
MNTNFTPNPPVPKTAHIYHVSTMDWRCAEEFTITACSRDHMATTLRIQGYTDIKDETRRDPLGTSEYHYGSVPYVHEH